MKDFNYQASLDNDDRIAAGSIKITDFEKLVGAKAAGSIEVLDYEELIGLKASGTITITAYASLSGKTFTIGGEVLTEGVDFTAGVSNDATATSLAAAIHALTDVTASAVGPLITIEAAVAGRDGNSIGLVSNAAAGYTFSENNRLMGGIDHATITVGEDELVQGTDFTAETSNAATATNIAAAIDLLADFTGAVDGVNDALVVIEAAAVGVAGNVTVSATWDNDAIDALTVTTMTGGVDQGTVTFGTTVLTQGTDFNAATTNAATATSLTAALTAIEGYTATVDLVDNTLINIVADAAGGDGNVTVSTNASDSMTVVEMTGGADYFYSDVFEYDQEDNKAITVDVEVTLLDEGASLQAWLEVSADKQNWETVYQFDTISAAGTESKSTKEIRNFARIKMLPASGDATVEIRGVTSMSGDDGGEVKELVDGRTAIAVTGIAVPISTTSLNMEEVDITAVADVRIGGADVSVTEGSETGTMLYTGSTKTFKNINLKDIYINGTAGNAVTYSGTKV